MKYNRIIIIWKPLIKDYKAAIYYKCDQETATAHFKKQFNKRIACIYLCNEDKFKDETLMKIILNS